MTKQLSIAQWLGPLLAALAFYFLPLTGLEEGARRIGCIFIIAACYWVLEVVPIYATSLLIMLLEILFISDKTMPFLQITNTAGKFYITQNEVFASFASTTIILFLGGLFLAQAATKYKLDQNLARVIFQAFGTNSATALFSLMIVTAVFSMFMSNTATTAMMLAIVVPIAAGLSREDPLGKALILSVPIASNIGGIGTPIGTPPNAVALAALEKAGYFISFGKWMVLGVPYVLILLGVAYALLRVLFKSDTRKLSIAMEGAFLKSREAKLVYAVFGGTIILWLTEPFHALPSALVAFLPVVIFSLFGIVGKKELRLISWDILWLIAGGMALGEGMEKTGLNTWVVGCISFETLPPVGILALLAIAALALSTFISNTATANLLVPIALSLSALHPASVLLLPVVLAFACSIAMALPISTPPNALAYGTGFIDSRDLLKTGLVISVIGFLLLLGFSKAWQWAGLL